ncbi:hypothetical protein AVEN_20776-1 [Araneus ventricosus]|uniref:Uncharacterized protein n=1 Tax=Araneus ventricosus TaxID=182803 RepID=A0A4Y2KIK9_ARAVE|nr:hypothetical protein AVEN_20776-1 [Araneus ventricosus]
MENGDRQKIQHHLHAFRPTNLAVGMFSSLNGPFPSTSKVSNSCLTADYCRFVDGIGTRHFTMPQEVFTQCLGIEKPPNFEQEWLKRVANNVSRHKILRSYQA